MRGWMRWVVIAAGVGAIVVLFIVLQPGADPGPDPTSSATVEPTTPPPTTSSSVTPTETESTEPTATQTTEPPTSEPPTSQSPSTEPPTTGPAVEVIRASFISGEVTAPQDARVTLGSRVEIVVEADIEEEVHLHTYDLKADVAPGEPARIRFRADIPGRHEVELEGAGRLLFLLQVVP